MRAIFLKKIRLMKAYLLTLLFSVFSFCAYAQTESLVIKAIRHLNEDVKYGLMTSAGKEIVPARYEYVNRVFEGHYLIKLDGKYAVADSLLNPISDFYNDHGIIETYFPAHYFAKAILDENIREAFLNNVEVMSKKYKSYEDLQTGLVRVRNMDLCGIIDSIGNEIVPLKYGYIKSLEGIIYTYDQEVKKQGVVDRKGKEVLPSIYDDIYSRGIAYAVSKNGKYAITDTTGKVIAPLISDSPIPITVLMETGLIKATVNGKSGIVDTSGNIVIPFEYDGINLNSFNTLSTITKNGKIGFINKEGKIVAPLIYDDKGTFGGIYGGIGTRDGMKYYLDSLGNEVLSSKYRLWVYTDDPMNGNYIEETDLSSFFNYYDTRGNLIKLKHTLPDSLHRFEVDDLHSDLIGFLDGNNKLVIPYQYSGFRAIPRQYLNDSIYYPIGMLRVFDDGKCVVRKKNFLGIEKTGIIDRYGKELVPIRYQDVEKYPFLDICTITENNKIAFANINNGQLLTKFKYAFVDANKFKNGYFIVENKEKKGVVNIAGQEILPCEYDGITAVSDAQNNPKFFILGKNGKSGLADSKTGEITIPCQYSSFFPLRNNTEYIRVSKKIGDKFYKALLESSTGKEILPFIYDDISWFGDKAILVKKDNLYGIIDLTGKEVAPCEYKEIIIKNHWTLDNLLIFGK